MTKKLKRVVAVITFEDGDNDVGCLSDAATWFDLALSRSTKHLDVTVYSTAKDAALDEADLAGDFADTDVALIPPDQPPLEPT